MATLRLPDAAIHYEQAGRGSPPIVLVHGGMCDHRDWDRLAPLLADRHTVVRPDLRGHGGSTGAAASWSIEQWAADVVALIAQLGLARPVLVGHSLASRVIAQAAACADVAIGGIVLLDGSRGHGGHAAPAPAGQPAPADLHAMIEATIGPFADAETRAAVHATMGAASPELMAGCVAAMREWDLGQADAVFARLAGDLPLLAIQATYHDPATPRRSLASADETTPYLDFLRAAVPQLEVAAVARAGHFLMLERPAQVAGLIHDFAEQTLDNRAHHRKEAQ
jgi:3-oxoadipate enol-lactonase